MMNDESEKNSSFIVHRSSFIISCLGWAVYLACSWTWCIGMFLPVILVRDLGVAGWIVFAVPNVLGAAAMGWVLGNGESSRKIVENHRGACTAFSLVTVAFHVFFVMWISGRMLGSALWVAVAAGVAIVMWSGRSHRSHPERGTARLRGFAAFVFVISLVAFGQTMIQLGQPGIPKVPAAGGAEAMRGSLYLAPVCAFGFLLCPYLDLTFHRARQALGRGAARVAFTVGFGVLFLAMIVFSLVYAGAIGRMVQVGGEQTVAAALAMIVGLHMLVQSGFTVGVHFDAAGDSLARLPRGTRQVVPWVVLFLPLVLGAVVSRPAVWFGLDSGEMVYRCFMGFYGLLFPAYVWVCMIGRGGRRADGVSLGIFAVSVLAAGPIFFMGFVLKRLELLGWGLAVPLAAGVISWLRMKRR